MFKKKAREESDVSEVRVENDTQDMDDMNGVEDGEGKKLREFKPDPNSKYTRDHWPAYSYPERKKFKFSVFALILVVSIVVGLLVGKMGWDYIEPYQHHAMYTTEQEQITAKWKENTFITVSPGLLSVMKSSSYYGTTFWDNMNPEPLEDGSMRFHATTGEDFYLFVKAIRDEIDALIVNYSNDATYQGFTSGDVGLDYLTVTVSTDMKKASLIDQKPAEILVKQLKIHSLFYDAGKDVAVSVVFKNQYLSEPVLILNM
jgi:hypothetical protein